MDETSRVHLLLSTADPYGTFVTTPQRPGLVIGRPTIDLLDRALNGELQLAGFDQSSHVVVHSQTYLIDPAGREFLLRVAEDEFFEERKVIANLLAGRILSGFYSKARMVRDTMGQTVMVVARREDALRWIYEQMFDGDALMIAVRHKDGVRFRTVGGGPGLVEREDEGNPWSAHDVDWDLTIGALMDSASTIDMWGEGTVILEAPANPSILTWDVLDSVPDPLEEGPVLVPRLSAR